MDDNFEKIKHNFFNFFNCNPSRLFTFKAILDFFPQWIASLERFSTLVYYYFKFSFDVKAILYIAKKTLFMVTEPL